MLGLDGVDHALLAWLLALEPENQDEEATRKSIRMLDHALSLSSRCESAYFWRGMLHRRLGEGAAALLDFKHAADLNPQNIDAVREVRLANMRGGSRGPPAPGPGSKRAPSAPLLDGIFKKR